MQINNANINEVTLHSKQLENGRMMAASIQASKALLRKEIKARILKLTAEEKARQTDNVLNKLMQLPAFQKSDRVSIYLSTDHEISTELLVKQLFALNKKCFVPRYNGDVMEMVRLNSMEDWENLPLTKWKIKQPDLSEDREEAIETGGLDLIIVPGVAFTTSGVRLGHGKGYYDSFFTKIFYLQKTRPITVGLCFKEQLNDSIPVHEHDVIIDQVLYSD